MVNHPTTVQPLNKKDDISPYSKAANPSPWQVPICEPSRQKLSSDLLINTPVANPKEPIISNSTDQRKRGEPFNAPMSRDNRRNPPAPAPIKKKFTTVTPPECNTS
ncbi:unnamed protein product [Heterobilharzia americana]|nr:unnamed protein product [Heterobilharzia americana]